MKSPSLLTLIVGLIATSSYGALYDYSYTWASGNRVHGTLQGTLSADGQSVDGVSDITLFFNNTPMNGTLYAASVAPGGSSWLPLSSLYFNAQANNFIFVNFNIFAGDWSSLTEQFWILPYQYDHQAVAQATDTSPPFFGQDSPAVQGHWSLTTAPEPTTIVAGTGALGLALTSLCGRRRR